MSMAATKFDVHVKSSCDGVTTYWSHTIDDQSPTVFEIRTFPGTTCEKLLKVTVYQEAGKVTENGEKIGYNPTYGYTIEVVEGEGYGYSASGIQEGYHYAMMQAMGRACSYGNGGFPLERYVRER